MSQNYITGLDIGTSSLKAVIGEVKNDGQLSVVKILKTPSGGMRKGSIDDLSEMTRALNIIYPCFSQHFHKQTPEHFLKTTTIYFLENKKNQTLIIINNILIKL